MKLSLGNLLNTIKAYMYITNEYGKPSDTNLELFIETFGVYITRGDLSRINGLKADFDKTWLLIKADLKDRGLAHLASFQGGYQFWVDLLKSQSTINSEGDLREFINNYTVNENRNTESSEYKESIEQKYNYKLSNNRYIGHELTIIESVDDIDYTYKAKVIDNVNIQLADTNLVVNINKFIEEVEDRNVTLRITMGFFRFEDIYREEQIK